MYSHPFRDQFQTEFEIHWFLFPVFHLSGTSFVVFNMDSSSRKRAHTDEHDTPVAKKRALSGANGSPRVNGLSTEQEEPTENDNLEVNSIMIVVHMLTDIICGIALPERGHISQNETLLS